MSGRAYEIERAVKIVASMIREFYKSRAHSAEPAAMTCQRKVTSYVVAVEMQGRSVCWRWYLFF